MRALWPERKKPNGGEGKATCHRDRKAVGTLAAIRIGAAVLLQGSRRTREAACRGGIASGDDGAAMRSVLMKGNCRGGAPFSGEVRRRPVVAVSGHFPLAGDGARR